MAGHRDIPRRLPGAATGSALAADDIPVVTTTAAELLDPAVTGIAIVLTPPASHAHIAAIRAGLPGVYVEKPLATSHGQAHASASAASNAGALLGAAPDTILGGRVGGHQPEHRRLRTDHRDVGQADLVPGLDVSCSVR